MLARKTLSKKKVTTLTITILAVWVITGWVLWRNFFKQPSASPSQLFTSSSPPPGTTINRPTSVQGDPKLLSAKWYQELESFGEALPIQVRGKGRPNPFISLSPPAQRK